MGFSGDCNQFNTNFVWKTPETRVFNGREYLLEEALPLDYAFIRA